MAKNYDIALANETDSGWSLWRQGRVVASAADLGDLLKNHPGAMVGVPVAHCATFSQILPTQDDSVFGDMVFSQVEKRGLVGSAGRGVPLDFHKVAEDEGQTLLSIDVLSSELPEVWSVSTAAAYFPSARLLGLPVENDAMLWREHGRLVMAASVHGRITATIQLSASDKLDAALAQEVNLVFLSMQAEGSVGENPRLALLGGFPEQERAVFEKSLMMSVEYCPGPVVRLGAEMEGHMDQLLPLPVREERRRKRRARKRNALAMAVFGLYAMVGASFWAYSQQTKRNIEDLERQVEGNRPQVRKIEEAARRWLELAPAFDLKRYPLVQLNEVARLMPPSGVLIREFETKGSSVRIRGQARDAQIAFQFEEDLKSSEFMGQYRWNMPQPKVEKNNTATFEIQGELGSHL